MAMLIRLSVYTNIMIL